MLKRINLPLVGILLACALVALGAYVADWHQIALSFRGVDARFVLLSVPFLFGTFIVFAARWGQLIATESPPPTRELFSFLMIGYLANAILPARSGDMIRAVLLRQRLRVSLSTGLASLVLERAIDLGAVCALGIVMSMMTPVHPLLLSSIYIVSGAVYGFLALLLLASRHYASLSRLMKSYPRAFQIRFPRIAADWFGRFAMSVNIASSPRRIAVSVMLTVLGWILMVAYMMSLIAAFDLPVPASAALLVLIGTNLGALMPLSPGAIGVWHFMAVLALTMWGVNTSTAIAFAIGSHAIGTGIHVVLGIACASYQGIRLRSLPEVAKAKGVVL